MMSLILVIAIIAGVVVLAVLGWAAYYAVNEPMRQAAALEAKRAAVEERMKQAVWAGATVITVNKPPKGHYRTTRIRLDMRLEVTPAEGEAYTTKTSWLVDEDTLHSIQPGSELSVKVDRDDPMIVYPNMGGAEYRVV